MQFLDDLRNLDTKNIGDWPRLIKLFFTVLTFVMMVFFGWYVHISNQQSELKNLKGRESNLKQEFIRKQAKAINLKVLEIQLSEMKSMLQRLLRQLPSKTEMPELLTDISQTALSAGLQVELFKPGTEVPHDFYAEQPIQLRMTGSYHQFGTFISSVASMPRVVILTMHDVSLKPLYELPRGTELVTNEKLVLQGTVKTYHYLDDNVHTRSKKRTGGLE